MVASLDQLEYLLSAPGTNLLATVSDLDFGSPEASRRAESLRLAYPAEMVAAAFTLTELRRRASSKFSRAEEMMFTRAGLEQASSEEIARHRSRRFGAVHRIADLCTGIGGDLLALGDGRAVVAVDRDPLHLKIAAINADVYATGQQVTMRLEDVRETDLREVEGVFIDPARRTDRGRMGRGDSEPPLAWCFSLADRVAAVGMKAAPGLDHDTVPAGWEIEFVAIGRDLKEAALWSPALAGVARRATILLPGAVATLVPVPGASVAIAAPGDYLLDPNPAVTRAGLVVDLACQIGAWQIDEQIAFLATDVPIETPFARTLRVIDSLPWHLKRLSARLRELEIGTVEIRRRGLAGDVDEIKRRLKLRGPRRALLAMTRRQGQPWCLICEEIMPLAHPSGPVSIHRSAVSLEILHEEPCPTPGPDPGEPVEGWTQDSPLG